MASNYEFLEMLHRELKPRGYLEIGVRHGDSLRLAKCEAIGIDPDPKATWPPGDNFSVYHMESDQFFSSDWASTVLGDGFDMDLVYIDGMHLYEYALRDFLNVVRWANERTVIVFDDTHPYNQAIATRAQPPGDWTGDVWKTMDVISMLKFYIGDMAEVDVSPTGAFVVWNIDTEAMAANGTAESLLSAIGEPLTRDLPVPADIIDRRNTITPDEVVRQILESRP